MRKEKNKKNVFLLIREGAGTGNILRIKSTVPISEQRRSLVKISLSNSSYKKIPKEIGPLAEKLVKLIAKTISSLRMISFRRDQIIFDLGAGNVWTEADEEVVKQLVASLLINESRDLTIKWFVDRQEGGMCFPWPGEKDKFAPKRFPRAMEEFWEKELGKGK